MESSEPKESFSWTALIQQKNKQQQFQLGVNNTVIGQPCGGNHCSSQVQGVIPHMAPPRTAVTVQGLSTNRFGGRLFR